MSAYVVTKMSCTNWRAGVLERRRAKRFKVGWDVTVRGVGGAGFSSGEAATLENLSSNGAFLYLTEPPELGAKLEVAIRIPFKRQNWMKYTAEVVRVEGGPSRVGVAMRFDSARPLFEAE